MKFHIQIALLVACYTHQSADASPGTVRQRQLQDDYFTEDFPRGPVQVGDALSTSISPESESSRIPATTSSDGSILDYEINFRPGAPYTTVHFSEFNVGDLCKMVVSGKDLPDGREQ